MTLSERRATKLVTREATGEDLLQTSQAPPQQADAVKSAPEAKKSPLEPDAAKAIPAAQAPVPETVAAKPIPAAAQSTPAHTSVGSELIVVFPPGGDWIDFFVRLKPSGALPRTIEFTADIQLPDGKSLAARHTGDRPADPLYAALDEKEFCALHRAGTLAVKIIVNTNALPGWPRQITADLSKHSAGVAYAAKHCGT